jgi:hypothetical protein
MATKIVFSIRDNEGYRASDVSTRLTLGELAGMIEDAIAENGEDAEVVTFNLNNPRGASWGYIDDAYLEDAETFEAPESMW